MSTEDAIASSSLSGATGTGSGSDTDSIAEQSTGSAWIFYLVNLATLRSFCTTSLLAISPTNIDAHVKSTHYHMT